MPPMFESPWHWAVVAIVAFVLFFGWKQLPDMARSLGRSLRVFKTEMKGLSDDEKARADAEHAGEPQPKALPQAEVVKREALPGQPAREAQEAQEGRDAQRARPRPSPSPNRQ
jgi:sec-independent protein translocase protein TatA